MNQDLPDAPSADMGLRRPTVDSIAATATIALILVAVPILIMTRLPRWISDGIPDGLILSDVTVIPALVLFIYLAQGLIASHREKAIDLRPADAHLRKEFSRVVERSHFGVGRAHEWTTHNPQTSLASVNYNVVFDRRNEQSPNPTSELLAPEPVQELPIVAVAPVVLFTKTEEYEVQRGDSWWTLAVDRLQDGRRWSEIRDLNLNRSMPDGTVLTPDAHLLKGFFIVVPAKAVDDDA